MAGLTTRYIVADHPPWYYKSDYKDVFTCKSTQGLFDKVVHLMMCKQQALSEREKRYKPKTIYKIIRDMVIKDSNTIQEQQPSRLLLLALMDLVDIESGTGFESMSAVDKAGVKHVLLAHGNYTNFFIPTKELISPKGKKVIPVVTQYSEKHNFVYCDSNRSMIGTYTVGIPKNGKGNGKSYFVQEVLFVPGPESLDLLKTVTGSMFEFWDLTLEVPTHSTALTPSFQQIQPVQLLRTEDKTMSAQVLVSHMEEIAPMCCVLGTASADMLKKKRETRVDCFMESEVICDLKHFHYENHDPRTVYFRRSSKFLDGKRVNLVPVVVLRKSQALATELYVSTTVRFCRAVKQSCVKGNGELVSNWNDTLQELERDTFITGAEMYQEIHNPALAAFIKRVNPTSWCNYIPKHVESMISDPIMVEVVELAIVYMDCKIPNAFAVAELLHCPLQKVKDYVMFWNMYSSDKIIHTAVKKKRASMVEQQMSKDWLELAQITCRYMRRKYGSDDENHEMASAREELFKPHTPDNVAKAQRTWHSLIKHDTSKVKDKDLVKMYTTAKVLFLKLRTYHNKLKKYLKVGEGERERCDPDSESSSPHSTQVQDPDMSSKNLAHVDKHSKEETGTGDSEKSDTCYSIVTPETIPISTWIKNLPTLLLSEPWLKDESLRRDAVCTLLGLDNTLLDKRHGDILADWVSKNETIVNTLQSHGLQDRLSKALIDSLECMSTNNWRRKISVSFQGTLYQPRGDSAQPGANMSRRGDSAQPVANLSRSMKHGAERAKRDSGSTHIGKRAKKQRPLQMTKPVNRDRSAYKSNESVGRKISWGQGFKKYYDSQVHNLSPRCSGDDDHPWLSQAEEATSEEEDCNVDESNIPGDDLEATMGYDNSEAFDEYDYSDSFINDRSTGNEHSSEEEEEDDAFCAQVKKRVKLAKSKTKNAKWGHWHNSWSQSESEQDAHTSTTSCSGLREERSIYKHTLLSDSEDSIRPDCKRVKLTKPKRLHHKRESKRSRRDKGCKEPVLKFVGRKDKVCAKKRLDKSNTRCETAKTKIQTHNRDSQRYKNNLSDPEEDEDDYQREGPAQQSIKRVPCSKSKSTRSPVIDTDSEQEDVRTPKKIQKSPFVNRPRENLDNPGAERSLVQQDVSNPQQLVNLPGVTGSHRRSGVSRDKEHRLHVDAGKAASVTDQAAWLADTTQRQCSDQEDRGEYHHTHPSEPTSAAKSECQSEANTGSQSENDSELDFNARLDKNPARARCSASATYSGETEYFVSM